MREQMTDLISRQAAIDCVNRAVTKEAARWAIQDLPSAEPDVPDTNVGDMISRQAAIDALGKAGLINYNATGDGNGMIHAINVIKGLPAAGPKPCDFCANRDDCEDMRIYCPARPNDATAQFTGGSKTGVLLASTKRQK